MDQIKKVSQEVTDTCISIIHMSYFHGVELAMNAGVDLAIGDFVFEFDNTVLDFEKSVIMKVYCRSLEGYDIVSASPKKSMKFTSKLFYHVFTKFTEQPHPMNTESFRVLSRRVINRIHSMNRTVPYRKAVYANCGLNMDHMTYESDTAKNHRVSDKKERFFRINLAVDSLILFTEVGYRFSMAMTILMMFLSIFMTFYSFFTYLIAHPVEGWTTTVLFFSVAFFGLFGILTIIVKYLQLLINLVFKRKYYSFQSVEKLTK